METRSTQLNTSFRGRLSRMTPTRWRISASRSCSRAGETAGVAVLRCTSCLGGSMAMNMGGANPSGLSPMTMSRLDEKTWWLVSTATMSWKRVMDQ